MSLKSRIIRPVIFKYRKMNIEKFNMSVPKPKIDVDKLITNVVQHKLITELQVITKS